MAGAIITNCITQLQEIIKLHNLSCIEELQAGKYHQLFDSELLETFM